jgi:hypothetical protein
MESKGGIRPDVLWLPSLYSFHLIDPSVPELDCFGGRSTPASGSTTVLVVDAVHVPAVAIPALDFFEFSGRTAERATKQPGLFHILYSFQCPSAEMM